MSDLAKLWKLVALATPPATGSDEEAKRAALLVCKMIRDGNLFVYDPSASKPGVTAAAKNLADRYAEAVYNNPTRVAMRERAQDRIRQQEERRNKAHLNVGGDW